MKFLARFAFVFVIASAKCLPAEETTAFLNEVQKNILDFKSDMPKINRNTSQDHQYIDQLILNLNQAMSRYTGSYENTEPIWNYILEIFPMYLDWIRALQIGFRKEKINRIELITGLRNLNQENHDLKQELESVIGVLTTLEENIKNQSQQLKEMKDELKESKAREKDLRTTILELIKNQNQELEELQNEHENQSLQFKELHDELRELKASENDQNQELKELQENLEENKDQSRQLKVMQYELKELKAKDLQIRLVQNDSLHASEGRLEIFYDGEWGTVCDDNWDNKDATVVCKMLGFSYGMATTNAFFGEGTGRIVLDEAECQGHESRLDNCKYAWRRHDCGHHEDAGVICKHETSPDVRLHFELLEISHNGIWGSVCKDSFGTTEATVACRMLEYRYGYTRKARVARVEMLLENVNCKGNETSIKHCLHNGWGIHDCDQNEAVGILCRDLANKDLRLTGGGFHNQGRIEIFYRGQWGTVCDDGWDDKDATVACRMLGFMYGKARIAATFGQGSGPIWLDDVQCKGSETNIEDCQHGGWGRENCFHLEDAGVVCQ